MTNQSEFPNAMSADEFERMFPDDEACAEDLFRRRWPDGFVCPDCGSRNAVWLKRKRCVHQCRDCRKQASVTARTLEDPDRGGDRHPVVNAKVKFPKSAEAEFLTFRCFGDEPVQSSVRVSFLGRPRFFGVGGVIGAFVRTCSGMRSACFPGR